jgi:mannose-1-phosphate guanylyltransferase/mannose-6-phosphate isomerase
VQSGRAGIVLLAVEPTSPAGDLGWILPATIKSGLSGRIERVRQFVEKPPPALAAQLFAQGGLWNTMILVARVSRLLELYRTRLPALSNAFDQARSLPVSRRGLFLSACYPQLPSADLSHDLLAKTKDLYIYRLPEAVGWTDLGTPARLQEWLQRPREAGSTLGLAGAVATSA